MGGMTAPRALLLFVTAALAGCSADVSGPIPKTEPEFAGRDGLYTVSNFQSGARGRVRFSVYLPPGWTPEGGET